MHSQKGAQETPAVKTDYKNKKMENSTRKNVFPWVRVAACDPIH
jgi:hypothetical protein